MQITRIYGQGQEEGPELRLRLNVFSFLLSPLFSSFLSSSVTLIPRLHLFVLESPSS